jgi:putative solute:sodium symporter small subunit
MQNHPPGKTDMHSEEFLHLLMRKQLKLSIACALAFLVVLLGLPLANYFAPELMARRIFGFTLTWFLLGIGFFPAVWCIAFYFIRRSIRLEEEEVREVTGGETESGKVGK